MEATLSLTHTDILGMFAAPKEVIPAPGAGLMIVPSQVIIIANNADGAYTVGGSITLSLNGASGGPQFPAVALTGTPLGVRRSSLAAYLNLGNTDLANKPLRITNYSGAFAGGGSANTLDIKVIYTIESSSGPL